MGLTPLCPGGAQEAGGAIRPDSAVPAAPGDDGINLQSLIEELSARSSEIKAAREQWEVAKAVVPQVQTLPDPRLQLGYQRMPMTEPFQSAMYGIGQEIPFPGKLSLKGDIAQRGAERLEQEFNPHFEYSPCFENMERLNYVLQDRRLMVTLAISIRTVGQIIQERNS
ncbi:MAG: hypothetical protein K2Q17_07485 [Nitrospiraceae bacterium]|nr:hypothetical protein [Nitrospiraceae bacterium]